MSTQCKIIEDLLPLYHDGVCSEESREMVDSHLAQCENCRKTLEQIDGELLSPAAKDTDINLLKSITKQFILSKRKALIKGVVITLSLILAIFLYNTILWYVQEYSYYAPFTEGLTQIPPDPTPGTVRFYQKWDDAYTYSVKLPDFLSRNGDARILKNDKDSAQVFEAGIGRKDRTTYYFLVNILREETKEHHAFYIDCDLNLYQWKYRYKSDSEIAQIQAELDEHREEIQEMVNAAKAVWPFIQ